MSFLPNASPTPDSTTPAARRFNVVKAYSIYDDEVGYTQGLQFIVGPLLLNVRSCSMLSCPDTCAVSLTYA